MCREGEGKKDEGRKGKNKYDNMIIIESGEQVYGGSLFCSFYFNICLVTHKKL